jgi:hypothetical protein
MATTYTLISSNVLASSAASVTFSAIPSTYTDLVLRFSARSDSASYNGSCDIILNGIATATYSYTSLAVSANTVSSSRSSAVTAGSARHSVVGATATASTFGSAEIYIPSYTVSQNKPYSASGTGENDSTNQSQSVVANLFSNTAAITSIMLTTGGATGFQTLSSFYLYGIKNS